MITLTISTLSLGSQPSIADLFGFMLYGFGLVMATLGFLAFVTHCIGKWFASSNKKQQAKISEVETTQLPQEAPSLPTPKSEPPLETQEEIPPEVLAVISAAINEVLESKSTKVRLRPQGVKDWSWSHSGRSLHHSSHKLR